MPQHKNIIDSERHEAKGASSATSGQVLKANGDGTTSFVSPNTLANIGIQSTLVGKSTIDQAPSATDTPLQVVFGSGGSNSHASIASNGIVTITSAGLYLITVSLHFSRETGPGSAILLSRVLVNGSNIDHNYVITLDDNSNTFTHTFTLLRSFNTSNTITVEIMRDDTGADLGGLSAFTPNVGSWGAIPSASIIVQKIAGGV